LGALIEYITHAEMKDFQPMKAMYGILPPLESPARGKRERAMQYTRRALDDFSQWGEEQKFPLRDPIS